ncbi:MAG: hypothetical protein ACK40H_04120, partial [Sphingomonadaceae bacterium]
IAELAWMDADGQSRWTPALFRALYHRARRHSAFARVGAPRGFTLERRAPRPRPAPHSPFLVLSTIGGGVA